MNRFTSHTLRLLTLLALLSPLLAACGTPETPLGTSASGTSPPPTGELNGPSARSSAAPSALAQTVSGATIKVTTTNAPDENNPGEVARHHELLAAFEKLRPDVVVEAHAGGFDRGTFAAKFAAGTMEDAYLVPFTEPQFLINNGYAADITDLMKGWDNFYSFNPEVLKIVQDRSGRIYGVPVGGYALGLIYNRKLFQDGRLDPDKPPTTWDELRQYARQIADRTDAAGFAELSKANQGGWHFTAWTYSANGDLEQQHNGPWTAAFNDEHGVKVLQLLKEMRWTDRSMIEGQPLEVKDVLRLIAANQVAMAVMAPDALRDLQTQYHANIDDFGIGPLPQNGGNATLAGGAAWIFNPKSTPEVRKAAFEWTINRDFNLAAYETDLKSQQERGQLVGWPELALFGGEFQQQRNAIKQRYVNAPIKNYEPYIDARLEMRPEPPIETQKLYGALDAVMQAVLADPNADPQGLLDAAAARFQTEVLDQVK